MNILAWQQRGVIACEERGHSPSFAAELVGLTVNQVYELRRRLGIQSRSRKYYAEDIAEIFELRESGMKWKDIADKYSTNVKNLEEVIARAKKKGFDAFPKSPA